MFSRSSIILRSFPRSKTFFRCLSSKSQMPSLTSTSPSADELAISIPSYPVRGAAEPVTSLRARLLYQSRKRGILENCLLLSNFASKHLSNMTREQLETYDHLLNQIPSDWDLYHYAVKSKAVPLEFDSDVMKLLQQFAENSEKQSRIVQPDL